MSCFLGIFVWHINHTYTVASTPSMIKFGSYERFRLFLSSVASHVYLDNDFIAANLIWNFFLFCINQPANWENFFFLFPQASDQFTTANLVNIKFLVYIWNQWCYKYFYCYFQKWSTTESAHNQPQPFFAVVENICFPRFF